MHHPILAVLGVIGILFMAHVFVWMMFRRLRWGHHMGRRHHGRGCGRRGRGGVSHDSYARAASEVVKRRLRISPDQEDIVDHALRDARDVMKDLSGTWKDSHGTIAAAFEGEEVDEPALAAAFEKQDQDLARARHELASALKQVHAVLDDDQRARLVKLLAKGKHGWN